MWQEEIALFFQRFDHFDENLVEKIPVLMDSGLLQIRASSMQKFVSYAIQEASCGLSTQSYCSVAIIANRIIGNSLSRPGISESQLPFFTLHKKGYGFRGGHGRIFWWIIT